MLLRPRPTAVLALAALLPGCGDDGPAPVAQTETTTATASTSAVDATGPASSSTGPDDGSSTTDTGTDGTTGAPFEGRLLVTADWRNKTLTLADFDAIAQGATTRAEVVVGEVDLAAWEPGPLQVEVTPDGERAVVSISPGFFDGVVGGTIAAGDVPLDGTLLVVDLQAREVLAELPTAHVPMGIAISPDGSTAFTANYGHSDAPGSTLSVVDLETLTVLEDVEVGQRPEQVTLNADGALGLVNLAGDGTVVVFDPIDVAGTLSTPLEVSADPSDVDFIEGTTRAVVANSADPFTYTVFDLADPSTPTFVAEGTEPLPFPYALTRVPGTPDVLMTIAANPMRVLRIDGTAPEAAVWNAQVDDVRSFPLGVAIDAAAGLAFIGAPGPNVLVVQPLDGSPARTLDWLPQTGPTYVAIGPG